MRRPIGRADGTQKVGRTAGFVVLFETNAAAVALVPGGFARAHCHGGSGRQPLSQGCLIRVEDAVVLAERMQVVV